MNWLDFVLAAIIAISVGSGIAKGFFRLAIGLAATVLSILLASWFYGLAAGLYSPYVKQETFANFLGFVTVLLLVQGAGLLLAKVLALMTKKAGLGWADRALGGVFGLVRAILVSSVLVMVLTAFSWNPPPASVAESKLAPYVMEGAQILVYLTPREVRDGFHENYRKLKEKWDKTISDTIKKAPKVLSQ